MNKSIHQNLIYNHKKYKKPKCYTIGEWLSKKEYDIFLVVEYHIVINMMFLWKMFNNFENTFMV